MGCCILFHIMANSIIAIILAANKMLYKLMSHKVIGH